MSASSSLSDQESRHVTRAAGREPNRVPAQPAQGKTTTGAGFVPASSLIPPETSGIEHTPDTGCPLGAWQGRPDK